MQNNQENEDFNLDELDVVEEDDLFLRAEPEPYEPDNWADSDALASAGWGTDEDYGYFGDGETFE